MQEADLEPLNGEIIPITIEPPQIIETKVDQQENVKLVEVDVESKNSESISIDIKDDGIGSHEENDTVEDNPAKESVQTDIQEIPEVKETEELEVEPTKIEDNVPENISPPILESIKVGDSPHRKNTSTSTEENLPLENAPTPSLEK